MVVFENLFPSYRLNAVAPDEMGSLLTPSLPGRGVCEVVLYSDSHTASLACMDELQLQHLVEVWTDRYQALRLPKLLPECPCVSTGG